MKKLPYCLMVYMLLMACQKKHEFHSFFNNPGITKSFTSGHWHLAPETLKAKDSDYTDCDFTFKDNNILLIRNGNHTYWGKWSVYTSSGTDDSPAADTEFSMIFPPGLPHKIAILNHTYTIVKRTMTALELKSLDTPHEDKIVFLKQEP